MENKAKHFEWAMMTEVLIIYQKNPEISDVLRSEARVIAQKRSLNISRSCSQSMGKRTIKSAIDWSQHP